VKAKLTNIDYESKIKLVKSKKKGIALCLLSAFLLLGLLISPAAAAAKWKISPSSPAVGDTLKITGTASPGESVKAEVSFEKAASVSGGRYQYVLESVKVPAGNNRLTISAYGVKNLHVGVNKVVGVDLQADASGGVATISKSNIPPLTYKVLIDGDALSRSSVYLKFTASQTLTADSNGKFEFSYDTSSMPAGIFRIKVGNSAKTIILRSSGQGGGGSGGGDGPVADFSASPTSGKAPLEVTFTDKSTGSPTSWKWSFGDGKTSTEQNPVHTYSKSGKYTVTLTVKNASGTDTETKSRYITVSRGTWYIDNSDFWSWV